MFFLEGSLLDVMGCCAMSAGILEPIISLALYIHANISRIIWRNLLNSYPIRGNLSYSFQQSNALTHTSGVPRNFFRGGSTNSVEDRENGDLGVVAP